MVNNMEKIELSRTKIHELAFICVFQYLFYEQSKIEKDNRKRIDEIISDVMESSFDDCDPFFKAIVFEAIKDKNINIENIIQPKLVRWNFNNLSITDQAILLLFTSEILNNRVESHVAIDMALDLAHRYGAKDNSYKYINKVLDRISKEDAR